MAVEQQSTGEERTPLGALLVAEGLLNDVQLHQALHLGSQTGERLGEIVVRQGLASEEDVARLLAEQWDLGYVDRASIWFDANALARLSREDAQRLEAMPTRVEDGRVVVAVAEPTEERLAALREVIGEDTVVVVVPKAALEAGLHSELLKSNGTGAEKSGPRPEPVDEDPPAPAAEAAPPLELVSDGPEEPDEAGLSSEDDDLAAAIVAELPAYKQAKPAEEEPPPPRPKAAPPARPPAAPAAGGGLAEGIAQLIEAQISAAAAPAAESAKKLVELERRIKQLEKELAANRTALAELSKHLKALGGVLGKL
jgi:Type II secretion system (T2SS), protein E, N-terminal domain